MRRLDGLARAAEHACWTALVSGMWALFAGGQVAKMVFGGGHPWRSKQPQNGGWQHENQGSEAHGSVAAFHALTANQKQDVLNF